MKQLFWHSQFKKAFKSITENNPKLKERIFLVLGVLVEDHFDPRLKTHKLHGKLEGL
jgi:mRNA interferase YafQ